MVASTMGIRANQLLVSVAQGCDGNAVNGLLWIVRFVQLNLGRAAANQTAKIVLPSRFVNEAVNGTRKGGSGASGVEEVGFSGGGLMGVSQLMLR